MRESGSLVTLPDMVAVAPVMLWKVNWLVPERLGGERKALRVSLSSPAVNGDESMYQAVVVVMQGWKGGEWVCVGGSWRLRQGR